MKFGTRIQDTKLKYGSEYQSVQMDICNLYSGDYTLRLEGKHVLFKPTSLLKMRGVCVSV